MRRTTPYLFHALLFLAVGVTAGGLTMGLEHRLDAGDGELTATTGTLRASVLHRSPHARRTVEETIPPPLAISPRYGEEVPTAAVLSWRLADGSDGARIELCPTRDFDEATTRRIDAVGEELKLPASWPPGVWYWRLRGRSDGVVGDRATPTWMLTVRGVPTAPPTVPGDIDVGALTL